ncbi:NAD(P)H-hydrate dehydratase [Luteimonas sp. RD2P54]|uniref:Bifunctional NAD(P)H-hydrate repair enzyme n=1 Tax=Luteimonas endophytica TaxID=3042023 RepID=A0ABT6JBQ7_9GAMM|nr:NAD(P)H-hydrate dehydratase [Luteimonas endophytica]MDH5824259.1 NAD(P)H-hydrate dehydratase [Luteimonas endophytica]
MSADLPRDPAPSSPGPPPPGLYDGAALRALEAAASARLGGDAFELMRRAGEAAWRELLRHWPQARRIVVVCGPGNNGGDGYVLATHAHAAGCEVRAVRLAAHAPGTELARRACADYLAAGGRVLEFDGALPGADAVVDALFGIGLSRAPDAACGALIEAIAASGAPVLALDAPSGVDTDSGDVPGSAVRADVTVQFLAAHAGLRTGAALDHVGLLALASLGLPADLLNRFEAVAACLDASMLAARFAPRPRNSHKGGSGHVLCIGGDEGKGGAVLLAAEAALRSGAGLVSVATRPAHVAPLLARCPEAMVQAVESESALAPLVQRAGVLAVGPGLGQEAWGRALHQAALASGRPLVLDADALNLLASHAQSPPADAVLTPHPGEAARLLGISTREIQANRFAAARLLCACFGCAVVLKGAGTVVAAPGQRPRVIAAGNPGMAVGGMGDVLTGCIAALRAQGFPAFEAAATGALLHAAAGDAAAAGGERGLLPSDLIAQLRRLVNP